MPATAASCALKRSTSARKSRMMTRLGSSFTLACTGHQQGVSYQEEEAGGRCVVYVVVNLLGTLGVSQRGEGLCVVLLRWRDSGDHDGLGVAT